jgi:hypothetical protein
MALGHSARDTFAMLHERGVHMEAKPFSVGFRIEHPQSVIDRARWGRHAGHPLLGAADYKLVHHASNGRAVYSFCMCPGGTVVAATSEPGRVVTNGMSQYSRNERNANAGMVVGIDPQDYPTDPAAFEAALGATHGVEALQDGQHHPLAGIVLQRQLEANAYVLGGGNYNAPGQLVGDFLAGRASTALGSVEPSYKPGVTATCARPCPTTPSRRCARPCRPSAARSRASTCTTPCSPAWKRAPRRRSRSAAARTTRASTPRPVPGGRRRELRGRHSVGGVDGIKVGEAVARSILTTPEALRTFPLSAIAGKGAPPAPGLGALAALRGGRWPGPRPFHAPQKKPPGGWAAGGWRMSRLRSAVVLCVLQRSNALFDRRVGGEQLADAPAMPMAAMLLGSSAVHAAQAGQGVDHGLRRPISWAAPASARNSRWRENQATMMAARKPSTMSSTMVVTM